MHGKILLPLTFPLAGVRFATRPRERRLEPRSAAELADALEADEKLVPLPALIVEAARLPLRWPVILAAEELVRRGVFLKASAMQAKEAASVSGGDARHLSIGSKTASADAEPGTFIGC